MTPLRFLTLRAITFAILLAPSARAEDAAPAKAFSFSLKKGMPPTQVTLLWKDSMLQGMELRAKAGGAVSQRVKIGEGQTVGCDLDQEDLPPKWIGTLDYNGDGFQDLYLQVARGSQPTHAILLYDPKTKRFVASKTLASVQGLDLSTAAVEAIAAGRKLDECFGLVTKETMKPATITIGGGPWKKGDAIAVLRLGDELAVLTAEIGENIESAEGGEPAYTLACEPAPAAEDAFVGIAVIGAIGGITLDGAKAASTRVPGGPAGNRLYLRSCTSGEGMHLTALGRQAPRRCTRLASLLLPWLRCGAELHPKGLPRVEPRWRKKPARRRGSGDGWECRASTVALRLHAKRACGAGMAAVPQFSNSLLWWPRSWPE